MRDDPALTHDIIKPRPYWRRRFKVVVPLLLWVVVAVAVLLRFGMAGSEAPMGPTLALLLGLVCSGIGLLILATPLVFAASRDLWNSQRARSTMRQAAAALNSGDGVAAETLLLQILARPGLPSHHAVALHNLGLASLLQGRLLQARARMDRAQATGWLDSFVLRRHRAGLLQGRAMVCLGLGALDEAQVLLAELTAMGSPPAALRDPIDLAHLIADLKRRDFDAAWTRARHRSGASLGPPARRLLMLLRAYAATKAAATPEEAEEARGAATALKITDSWVLAGWPELQAFAREHGLLSAE